MNAPPDIHPSADDLKAFSLGKLNEESAEAVMAHLEQCPPCRRHVASLPDDSFLERLRAAHAPGRTPAAGQAADTVPPVPPGRAAAPAVPPEPSAVVARMLAKDPARRFQTPADVAQALAPFCEPATRKGEVRFRTIEIKELF